LVCARIKKKARARILEFCARALKTVFASQLSARRSEEAILFFGVSFYESKVKKRKIGVASFTKVKGRRIFVLAVTVRRTNCSAKKKFFCCRRDW
jgi:hypothetical protein